MKCISSSSFMIYLLDGSVQVIGFSSETEPVGYIPIYRKRFVMKDWLTWYKGWEFPYHVPAGGPEKPMLKLQFKPKDLRTKGANGESSNHSLKAQELRLMWKSWSELKGLKTKELLLMRARDGCANSSKRTNSPILWFFVLSTQALKELNNAHQHWCRWSSQSTDSNDNYSLLETPS